MTSSKFLISLTFCFCFIFLNGQEIVQHSPYGSTTTSYELYNEDSTAYHLIVNIPPDYHKDSIYPVLYYLDAWWLYGHVTGSYGTHYLTKEKKGVILVGISSVGDEVDWNRQRNLDFTPTAYDNELMKIDMNTKGIKLDETSTGFADSFLSFLESDIINFIENKYFIDSSSRSLLGHSFGGLIAYYTMISKNHLFQNYVLVSPAVWWNKNEQITSANLSKVSKASKVFMVDGEEESGLLLRGVDKLVGLLNENKNTLLELNYHRYPDKDHITILPVGIFDALEYLYFND